MTAIMNLIHEIGVRSNLYGNTVRQPHVFIGSSFNEVKALYDWGHIDERTWRRYLFAWTWSDFRFGGSIGCKHEAFWTKHGKHAYYRRINRVRNVLGFKLYTPPPE